ncbi:MAG: hypothetical protein KF685_07845 [Acidobacteria bacterium]|nr:hypothetical protein [Acidobacteriota bacterium]
MIRLIIGIALIGSGLWILKYGRDLPVWRNERRDDDGMLNELFAGPQAFQGSRMILTVIALVLGGIIVLISIRFVR